MIGGSIYGSIVFGSLRPDSSLLIPLSKNYTYSDMTDRIWNQVGTDNWQAGLTRLLGEAKIAVGQIAEDMLQAQHPYFLRRKKWMYLDTDNHLNFWGFNPFPFKVIAVVKRDQGGQRRQALIVDDPEFEALKSQANLIEPSTVVAMVESDYVELHGDIDRTQDVFEIVYLRQPDILTPTVTNYATTYIDLPDYQIGRLTQMVVNAISEN